MRIRPRLAAVLAVSIAGALSMPSAQAAAAKVHAPVEIGTFGGPWSDVAAVNSAGQVVGHADLPGIPRSWGVESGPTHAFSWTAAGGIVDLDTLGGKHSYATMVNASGQVAGMSQPAGEDALHSFSWTAAGGMVDIDGPEGRTSAPVAIADSGQVIGSSQRYPVCWYRCDSTPPQLEAFSWTPQGGTIDVGSLGGDHTSAVAVNNSGQVVGSSSTAGNGPNHAYVWTAEGGMVDLGTLGGSSSHALDVSDSGQIVGYSSVAGDTTNHAFSWTAAGGMVDIGTLGGPSDYVDIIAVSDAGQVVGTSYDRVAGSQPGYSWTSEAGMVNLGPDSRPHGVNASGAVVGGSRTADGSRHAFFWTAKAGMVGLGPVDGADPSYAKAINNANLVIGSSGGRAVVWQLPTDKQVDKKAKKR